VRLKASLSSDGLSERMAMQSATALCRYELRTALALKGKPPRANSLAIWSSLSLEAARQAAVEKIPVARILKSAAQPDCDLAMEYEPYAIAKRC